MLGQEGSWAPSRTSLLSPESKGSLPPGLHTPSPPPGQSPDLLTPGPAQLRDPPPPRPIVLPGTPPSRQPVRVTTAIPGGSGPQTKINPGLPSFLCAHPGLRAGKPGGGQTGPRQPFWGGAVPRTAEGLGDQTARVPGPCPPNARAPDCPQSSESCSTSKGMAGTFTRSLCKHSRGTDCVPGTGDTGMAKRDPVPAF